MVRTYHGIRVDRICDTNWRFSTVRSTAYLEKADVGFCITLASCRGNRHLDTWGINEETLDTNSKNFPSEESTAILAATTKGVSFGICSGYISCHVSRAEPREKSDLEFSEMEPYVHGMWNPWSSRVMQADSGVYSVTDTNKQCNSYKVHCTKSLRLHLMWKIFTRHVRAKCRTDLDPPSTMPNTYWYRGFIRSGQPTKTSAVRQRYILHIRTYE